MQDIVDLTPQEGKYLHQNALCHKGVTMDVLNLFVLPGRATV